MMKKSVKAGLVSTTLAASLLLSTTGVFAFTDVDSSHWAANDIAKLSNAGYINGYEDGSFAPSAFITRAEFVTIINKVKGVSARSYKTYPDVSSDAWYADQIDIATTAGFITGYDDGSVRPDACISRAEVAVVCYKAWNLTPEGQLSFTDSNTIGSWAQTAVATLAAKNVLSGYQDGSFRPDDAVTRAEVAKIVSRIMDMTNANTTVSTNKTPTAGSAGLSNTGVIINSGSSSSSGGSSSGSSSSTSAPTKTNVEDFIDGSVKDSSDSSYISKLKKITNYASTSTTPDSKYIELYKTAIDELVNTDVYDDYKFSSTSNIKKFSNDVSGVVYAVNNIVTKLREACKDGNVDSNILSDIVDDLESNINKRAENDDEVLDAVNTICKEWQTNVDKVSSNINGKKNITVSSIVDVLTGDYNPDIKEPTKTEQDAIDDIISIKPSDDPSATTEPIKKDTLETIIDYADSNNSVAEKAEVKTEIAKTTVYTDAVAALVSEVKYSDDTSSDANAAVDLAKDVNTVVLVTNKSVDTIVDLVKDTSVTKLDKDTLKSKKDEITKIINDNAANKSEVEKIMNEKSLDMYDVLSKVDTSTGKSELDVLKEKGNAVTTQDVLDLYAKYKDKI